MAHVAVAVWMLLILFVVFVQESGGIWDKIGTTSGTWGHMEHGMFAHCQWSRGIYKCRHNTRHAPTPIRIPPHGPLVVPILCGVSLR